MNITVQDFLGLLWCMEGNNGYHLWLAQVLPKKSMYSSWRTRISYMLGLMELIKSCWATSDLLRFCCHILIVIGVSFVALFIKGWNVRRGSVIVLHKT